MATIKLSYEQSSDAKTLTFTDESVLDAPISNYTRSIELWSSLNGTGTLLATLPFSGNELEVDYQITSDKYLSAKLIYVGTPVVAISYLNFTSQGFERNQLNQNLTKNCGGCKGVGCDPNFFGFIYLYLSQEATLAGNSGLANQFITASSKWLAQ